MVASACCGKGAGQEQLKEGTSTSSEGNLLLFAACSQRHSLGSSRSPLMSGSCSRKENLSLQQQAAHRHAGRAMSCKPNQRVLPELRGSRVLRDLHWRTRSKVPREREISSFKLFFYRSLFSHGVIPILRLAHDVQVLSSHPAALC